MYRTIMNEKGLLEYFWAKAVHITVYILNTCPTKALEEKTTNEELSGIKPLVSHFKILGCICYSHIPTEKRTKLHEKIQKYIFLGYSDVRKDYRLLGVKTIKLVGSKDVSIDEK